MSDKDPCVVHGEDSLVRELYETKLRAVEQRLLDHIRNSEKAAEHVAIELDRRLHETNGFKKEMSEQVANFITRREAISTATLIATIVSLTVVLIRGQL